MKQNTKESSALVKVTNITKTTNFKIIVVVGAVILAILLLGTIK